MQHNQKFIVSHPPFWHDGSSINQRSYQTMLAALPAAVVGMLLYGMPAVGVLCLSVSSAIFWELLMNYATKRPVTIADGNAAVIGLLFGMLLPATMPWWAVIVGTLVAVVIGKHIFGGIGSNPFNPVAVSMAILSISWKNLFDFNEALAGYDFGFVMTYPLATLKSFGLEATGVYDITGMFFGLQAGGIGAGCGIALIIGGIYLIARGIIRWEIVVGFIAGIVGTAFLFYLFNPAQYASPLFHLFTGYTLIGAIFLATEDSSSPVNFIPMLIFGAGTGILTVLIRNIGAYIDGVILAILLMNALNPLLDKIRPKAIGKVM